MTPRDTKIVSSHHGTLTTLGSRRLERVPEGL